MAQTEKRATLFSFPRQVSHLAWDEVLPVLRQRAAVRILEGYYPDNTELMKLKRWIEEGISQFGAPAAHPWKDSDVHIAIKMASDLMGQHPDGTTKAMIKRLKTLIDHSRTNIIPRCFCTACGNDLPEDFFVKGQISYCSCGSIYFPAASPEIAEAMGKMAALSSGWNYCVDEFKDYYLVLRRSSLPIKFKAMRNICPFCRMEFALQAASVVKCRCGASAIPNYGQQSSIQLPGAPPDSTISGKPKTRRIFGFWNPLSPRSNSGGLDLDTLKWVLSAELDNFTSHHFLGTSRKPISGDSTTEPRPETSPQQRLYMGDGVFSDLEAIISKICGPSQSQGNVKKVVVSCTPAHFHIQVTLKHNPDDLAIKEWSKISSVQWVQKDLRYSFKFARGVKNVEG